MLEIQNLSVRFGKNAPYVVEKINLKIDEKTKTVIIGETGSGKSVLLLAILRLLPSNAIVEGNVFLNGEDLLSMEEKQMYAVRGKKIGYVPQSNGTSLNPLLRVGKQLDESLLINSKAGAAERKREILTLMQELELEKPEKVYKMYPHQLSGGMRQRVLLAMGLCTHAPYIFADEPTKGIDTSGVGRIIDKFAAIQDSTLLCVTHDLGFAEAVGEQAVVMYAAQQVECCAVKELVSNPLHPYTQAMLAALPENGAKVLMGFAPPHDEFENAGCRFYDRCPYRWEKCQSPPPILDIGKRKVRCWKYAD